MVRNELQDWPFGGHVGCRSGGFGDGGGERADGFGLIGADAAGGAGVHRPATASRGGWGCEGYFK
jgi:hypothetical protein